MHRLHSGLTVVVAIKDGKSTDLRALLRSLNKNIVNPERLNSTMLCDFENSETTLVVSAVILPPQNYNGETLPATLVFATTYSGPLKTHLEDLVKGSKAGLCQIFKHCSGFPENESISDNDLISFLKSNRKNGAFGSRYSCITKQDIRREKELRKEIEDYLDNLQVAGGVENRKATDVKTLIQRHVKTKGDQFEWATKPARDTIIELASKNRAIILLVLLALIITAVTIIIYHGDLGWLLSTLLGIAAFLAVIALIAMIVFGMIHLIARSKNVTAPRPADDHVREVTATQLRPIINEMTAAAPLKDGSLRRFFYAAALYVINLHSAYLMKVPTVSSLRWLSINEKRRLLFLSNYSNTTDFYVREFLNGKTPKGVNFMFTHGQGFPDAKLLFKGGITDDPEGYMNVIHTHQHPTDLWYTHDYDLTIDQILKNRKIRNGLFSKMTEDEARAWLRLL